MARQTFLIPPNIDLNSMCSDLELSLDPETEFLIDGESAIAGVVVRIKNNIYVSVFERYVNAIRKYLSTNGESEPRKEVHLNLKVFTCDHEIASFLGVELATKQRSIPVTQRGVLITKEPDRREVGWIVSGDHVVISDPEIERKAKQWSNVVKDNK